MKRMFLGGSTRAVIYVKTGKMVEVSRWPAEVQCFVGCRIPHNCEFIIVDSKVFIINGSKKLKSCKECTNGKGKRP